VNTNIKYFNSYKFNNNILYDNLIDIFLNFDCEKFNIQISNLDFHKYFFDIYNFFTLDIEVDVELIKSKYIKFKNELIVSTNSDLSELSKFFSIYLNVINFKNDNKLMYDIKMQLKIIDSIIFVLSDLKLKNIYDNYYLNWHINNIDTNDDSFTLNLNKEKMDLINKVYINLYIEPIIKNEKADTEKLLAIFERVKQNFPKDYKEKTPEELDEIYEKMNTVTYNCNKIKFDSLDINKLLQTRINANANPNINYNYMNFITELLIKNNLDLKYSNDLINYWNWIKINLEYSDYNPNYNNKGCIHTNTYQNNQQFNTENFEKIEKK
jgi:hypothetical protein